MTRKLYWENPYRRAFEATVIEALPAKGPAVVLDATAFYPTSGGQPHDTGTLNGVAVVEVLEEAGRIIHRLAAPLGLGPVRGEIDWPRRHDHMQQHTGQHILSQALEQTLGARTVSFHLGAAVSTIDIDRASLSEDEAALAEERANAVVFEGRAISVREVASEEAADLALRRDPRIQGPLRVVTVEDFDTCACGGTHLRSSAEVGLIHIRRWERSREGLRLEFLCGARALRDYRERDGLCQGLANSLSVGVGELAEAVTRLSGAEQEARREIEALRRRLLDAEWPRLAAAAETLGSIRLVCRVLEGYDAGNMRYLAQALIQQAGMVALLAVREPTPQICFARAEDVGVDMGRLLREAAGPYGGRGGGRPHMAQGGGVAAEALGEVLAEARRRLAESQGASA